MPVSTQSQHFFLANEDSDQSETSETDPFCLGTHTVANSVLKSQNEAHDMRVIGNEPISNEDLNSLQLSCYT